MANPNTAMYPGAIPTDTGLTVVTDDFFTVLTNTIGTGDSSFTLNSVAFNYPCLILIDSEVMLITGISGSNATGVQRGYLGTTPAEHFAGSTVFGYIFAYHHNQVAVEIEAIATLLGVGGDNVVLSGSAAGGDLSGTYPDPTVSQVNGKTTLTLPVYIDYRPAISQGGTASLTIDTPSSDPATAVDSGNSNTIIGLARFTNGEANNIQGHFYISPDQTGNINIQIIWISSGTSGNVQWNVETTFVPNTSETTDPSYNAAQSVTTAVQSTAGYTNTSVINNLTQTGISTNGLMFWNLFRSSGAPDTLADPADIVEIIFTYYRAIPY